MVFESPDRFNAFRTQAVRRLVLREGREVARTTPAETTVYGGDRAVAIDFHR